MDRVEVSIICNAYNHEAYIAKCIDGFVMQKTSFPFEILIHDDASTDGTASIIREYEKKYPELIKPIYQTENQYSKGGVSRFQYPRAKGRYIAICEGDDYWTDPLKLQKQFDAMEQHPEIDICAHAARMWDYRKNQEGKSIAPRKENCIIPAGAVINGNGGFVATASLFYRAALLTDMPRFRANFMLDYTLQIHGSLRGGMLYLADCMSVYNYMVPGSWSARHHRNYEKCTLQHERMQNMLSQLNEDTDHRYDETIQKVKLRVEWNYLSSIDNYSTLFEPRFKNIRKNLSLKKRLKLYTKVLFPWTYKIKRLLEKK